MLALSVLNSFILLILSSIHINWAFGGSWGFANALPTNLKGERVLNPKKIDSAIVGIGLLSFAIYFLIYGKLLEISLPNWLLHYGIWVVSGLFMLRAIGDFKYIGIFKSVKKTNFGALDTKFYSPLCLFLSVVGIILIIIN